MKKKKKGVGEHENWKLFKGKRQGTRRVITVGRVM
jgi:hypothetical protein